MISQTSYTGWSNGVIDGLDENIQPLNTNTSLLFSSVRSLTCIYALISGLSSNPEFLHFKLFIERSLNLVNSPFFNFTKVFFELILSKIFKSVKTPSVLSFPYE